ncbi:Bdr family repetitive protein (plasmid) [Borrelia miyamotoi]|uniref:Bdr family repetitive protein n=3 Tax=Borrelia miyamotoi TaxID=47466 RepID=A0AAQ3CMP2_9SPIR|nr:Bdr family repetitive protein [Borrelia miyamotoi]MBW6183204.1 hypothetical protein [Pseudomonas aeruginosa]AHH06055.1 BDR-repeat family protein [Borrelia miyamotoi FR64b]ATQ15552.1 Bdr family repetitive protein [Borrelia miyamotoi]ATQ17943.1 Bdr family repetitive protein [Borrelia miyamotoi]ATQ19201.1 Bdr family repetitive protein [Borrelia miyamotoi]
MALHQPIITHQMVLAELIKAGINRDIADDLAYRYYKNELTFKDLEYLKENFDIKLKHLEEKIFDTKEDLINRMDSKFNELDNKIDNVENNLNNKIDNKFNDLDNKLDINIIELKSTLRLHNWMFGTVITISLGILLTIIFK